MYAIDFDNPFIAAASPGRRGVVAVGLVAVGLLAGFLFAVKIAAPSLAGSLGAAFSGTASPWREALVGGTLQAMVFAPLFVVAVIGASWERRRLWAAATQSWSTAPFGLLAGALGLCASALVAWSVGAIRADAGPPAPAGLLMFGAALVLFQASAEEVFFRGWLQPILCARWGPWLGLLATSGLFAVLHAVVNVHGPVAVLNLFVGGVLFGILALRSGGLVLPIAVHFAWNLSESGGLGLDPSPTGSLVHLTLAGPSLWSGGGDLLDGSLAATVVLVAMVGGLRMLKTKSTVLRRP